MIRLLAILAFAFAVSPAKAETWKVVALKKGQAAPYGHALVINEPGERVAIICNIQTGSSIAALVLEPSAVMKKATRDKVFVDLGNDVGKTIRLPGLLREAKGKVQIVAETAGREPTVWDIIAGAKKTITYKVAILGLDLQQGEVPATGSSRATTAHIGLCTRG